ncbi:MAG: HEPN domain-containing protein [Deltaproteobacteria bacterium]|nr:HEPN domain-containing protein [Deltaproteobacteria bacterium]
MSDRSGEWLAQAEHDLEQARLSRTGRLFDWACFAAQQAAEKAVKAVHFRLGREVWGHVVRRLLEQLPEDLAVSPELLDQARVLDAYYVPTRYPNGHPEGAPREHYGELQAREAIGHAESIVAWCRAAMAKRGGG